MGGREVREEENAFLLSEDRNQKYFLWSEQETKTTPCPGGSANPKLLGLADLPSSHPPCKISSRTELPGSATLASAIQAAVWQPEMCRIASPASIFGHERGHGHVDGEAGPI